MAYGMIQGALPFNSSPSPISTLAQYTNDPVNRALGASYQSAYDTSLNQNRQNYNNVLSGYQQTLQNQQQAQQGVQQGYGALGGQIQGTIRGVGAAQAQAIDDAYAQQSGRLDQQLISSGLGNSTVRGQMQRGPMLDAQKAKAALAGQMAQLSAGYQANIGLAGLGQQAQNIGANTGLARDQLGFMNSVNAQYPDARQYQQLMQQRGANVQGYQFAAMNQPQYGRMPYGGAPFRPIMPTRAPGAALGMMNGNYGDLAQGGMGQQGPNYAGMFANPGAPIIRSSSESDYQGNGGSDWNQPEMGNYLNPYGANPYGASVYGYGGAPQMQPPMGDYLNPYGANPYGASSFGYTGQ